MRISEKRRGTYVLFLTFDSCFSSEVGALGQLDLPPGEYCYVGSAMGGLDHRLDRHLSKEKRIRWHIDRLTICADKMDEYESYPDPIPECELARMAEGSGCVPVRKGFGCSDCKCHTHLFSVTSASKEALIADASLRRYVQTSALDG